MSIQIRCFHGTTLQNAENIKQNGFEERSAEGLWLGTGTYFFENGYEHARSWAERACENAGDKPAVLEAQLKIRQIIDLADRNHWPAIQKVFHDVKDTLLAPEQVGPEILFRSERAYKRETWKHSLDHLILDRYASRLELKLQMQGCSVDAVRCPFPGGRQVYQHSWLFKRSCNMIVVKNNKLIHDIQIHHI